jgi:hypothetical protein
MSIIVDLARSGRRITRVAGRRNEFTWRYMLNLRPTVSWALSSRAPLSGECRRVLADLDRDGVALTTASRLFGHDGAFADLHGTFERLMNDQAEEVEAVRSAALNNDRTEQKPYLLSLLGEYPRLDAASPYGRFALSPEVSGIAQGYFGMRVALRHYNIWCNFVTGRPPSQSQLWHRDPEDRYILKVFVCLGDVDENTGPFTYAPGTHPKGAVTREPEFLFKDGKTSRSNDDQVGKLVSPEKWVRGIGPAGTMIFADTRGLHKGGLAKSRERYLYTAEFTSPNAGNGGILTGRA